MSAVEQLKALLSEGLVEQKSKYVIRFVCSQDGDLVNALSLPIERKYLIRSQLDLLSKFHEKNNIYNDINGLFGFQGELYIFGFVDASNGFKAKQKQPPVDIVGTNRYSKPKWCPPNNIYIGCAKDEQYTFFYNTNSDHHEVWFSDRCQGIYTNKKEFYEFLIDLLVILQQEFFAEKEGGMMH